MSNVGGYTHLFPSEADVDLFADERAIYRYYDYSINVDEVTTTENPLIIPYSAGGFVITSFNPSVDLPEAITDVYVGENITTFGETYNMGLNDHGKSLQAIHVYENNPSLMSHKGVVYRKNGDEASETEYKDYWTGYVGRHEIHYFRGMRVTNGGTTSDRACWITQASKY